MKQILIVVHWNNSVDIIVEQIARLQVSVLFHIARAKKKKAEHL